MSKNAKQKLAEYHADRARENAARLAAIEARAAKVADDPDTFRIDLTQKEQAHAFRQEHKALHGAPYGASGGRYTYSFTPTGLGTVVKLVCNDCHAECDLTDYSM
jgi:hypothetical protein